MNGLAGMVERHGEMVLEALEFWEEGWVMDEQRQRLN